MCDFILVSVDAEHATLLKKAISYRLVGLSSCNWLSDIHGSDAAFLVMDGQCSCTLTSTAVENEPLSEQEIEIIKKRVVSKLSKPKHRKRGWTEEKIAVEANRIADDARNPLAFTQFGLSQAFIKELMSLLENVARVSLYVFSSDGTPVPPPARSVDFLCVGDLLSSPSDVEKETLYNVSV